MEAKSQDEMGYTCDCWRGFVTVIPSFWDERWDISGYGTRIGDRRLVCVYFCVCKAASETLSVGIGVLAVLVGKWCPSICKLPGRTSRDMRPPTLGERRIASSNI